MCLESQEAPEMMSVRVQIETLLMSPWWGRIPTWDLTDVTLVSEDTDDHDDPDDHEDLEDSEDSENEEN